MAERPIEAEVRAYRSRIENATASIDGWLETGLDGLIKSEQVDVFMRFLRKTLNEEKRKTNVARRNKDEENNVDKAKGWGRNVDRDDEKVDKHRGRDDTLGDAIKDVLGDDE